MLFNSFEFVFLYLPATWVGFMLLGLVHPKAAAGFLVVLSLVFYGWWSPIYLWLLIGSILFNYAVGYQLAATAAAKQKTVGWTLLAAGVAINLVLLAYFKYANFFLGNLSAVSGLDLQIAKVVLPLGISFFTFTQIAFLVDVHRGEAREYSLIHYALFVTYFPHLIAGPILHHREMMPQFAEPATYRPDAGKIAAGLTLFAIGLFKKVVMADNLAPFANEIFAAARNGKALTLLESWSGALAYTFQLYFDFSGYCDMAVGLSLMFGILIPINFASPYRATSIIDFWRRWHITLSRFLREYLYYPLGGNRLGEFRRYANILTVMVLGGFWHGAAWTFVAWGVVHGLALLVNHAWRDTRRRLEISWSPGPVLGWTMTFLIAVVGWVFFRAEDVDTALRMLAAMAGQNGVELGVNHRAYLGPLAPLVAGLGVEFVDRSLFSVWSVLWIGAGLIICLTLVNSQEWVLEGRDVLGRAALAWRAKPALGAALGLTAALVVSSMGGQSEFLYFDF